MRILIKNIRQISLIFLILLMSACEKDFLDINTDPNNPSTVPVTQLLPSAQVNIAISFGLGSNGLSDFATTVVHQTVQRATVDNYGITGNDFSISTSWNALYGGTLTDIREIKTIAAKDESWHYVGVAQIMEAYTYSLMVDVWGDIPFSQAIKGAELQAPKFDNGRDVYVALFTLIDEGIANLAKTSKITPAADDLIYGGNKVKWRKFAKTLKLKMYNQARLTDLYDAAAVSSLIAENDFITKTDDFEMKFGTSVSPENRNPAFTRDWPRGQRAYYISPYFYEVLKGVSQDNTILNGITDPRIPYYFFNQKTPAASAQNTVEYRDGGFISIWFGSVGPNRDWDQGDSQTIIGLYPAGGKFDDGKGGFGAVTSNAGEVTGQGDAPQRLLTYYARLYIQAELALTTSAGGDAKALFESAMRASFDKVNAIATAAAAPTIAASEIDSYVNAVLTKYDAGNAQTKLELVMTEKWIASFGFGVDPYTDYRRTGYPKMYDPNTDNKSFTVRSRDYPLSFPWDTDDLQVNPNGPQSQKSPATYKVFWDN